MKKLFLQITTGILAIWLATKFVNGVEFKGPIQIILLAGTILGLLNFFIKPLLKIITLPLRIITFGLFSLVINIGIIWMVSLIFPDLKFHGNSLLWTTILAWGLSLILPIFIPIK
jgi:putative membrane protein